MSEQQADYPTSGETCAWNDLARLRECPHPAWLGDPEGRCLYHSPENGKTKETARQVWAKARRKAEKPDPNFVGWHFPKDPDEKEFEDATFQGDAGFNRATFQGDAWFVGNTFQGDVTFEHTVFQGAAEFDGGTFEGDATFDGASFKDHAGFSSTFRGEGAFGGATFQGVAWFWGATFQGDAWFPDTTFKERVLFRETTFEEIASFQGAKFEPGIDVRFDTPSPWSWLWGRRPFRRTEEGETAYRLAKQAAQARGDYTEAGQYHYAEQCAIEARRRGESGYRPWRWAFWVWLLRLLFGRIVFGYGERPYYPLFIALAVIACWTGLYWQFDAIGPNPTDEAAIAAPATLGESLYFSLVTFTTLGYGDFKPKPNYRLLAGAEAALGAGLMATFIVCLTRKYMR
ncbi:MAG TPA: potassium channel family protein [Phycisphaerae bacterium]|nr:potassium channel family protein [Phycisphaerae bacterium]